MLTPIVLIFPSLGHRKCVKKYRLICGLHRYQGIAILHRYTLKVSSSNLELLYIWILDPMGTSSSYTHLKFKVLSSQGSLHLDFGSNRLFIIHSSYTHFKLSRLSTIITQALMNTKMHSTICTCNECTHNLSLRIYS